MRVRPLYIVVAIALGLVALGCSDVPDEPAVSPGPPGVTAGPGSTRPPGVPAATTGPQTDRTCPVDPTICDFALTLLPILRAGDADGLLRLAEPVEATCQSQGFGGPSPSLCAGASPGQTRAGFWDIQAGEGLIVPEADLRRTLERVFLSIREAGGSDAWGPGELRIGSISCTRVAGVPRGQCDGQIVRFNFTFINSPQTPAERGTGIPGQRTTFFVQVSAIGSFKVRGIGTTVPPNAVLESMALSIAVPGGQNSILESYPWRP